MKAAFGNKASLIRDVATFALRSSLFALRSSLFAFRFSPELTPGASLSRCVLPRNVIVGFAKSEERKAKSVLALCVAKS
jgi:hypothetical protein